MRIIARNTLLRFVDSLARHRDQGAVKDALDAWFQAVRRAQWHNSADVTSMYGAASIVGSDRVVFNIRGNHYRLVVAVDYERQIVFTKWIRTHEQYDRIDVRSVQYGD